MSRYDGRDERQAGRAAGAGSGATDGACQADNLRGLLERIASQINDADQRHTRALSEMGDRLAGLGREAESVRRMVPAEFAPAFERIEDAMAQLAERIAAADRDRRAGRLDEPAATATTTQAARLATVAAAQSFEEDDLIAATALLAAQRGEDGAPDRPAAAEPDHAAPAASEPWDAESVEALARVYHPAPAQAAAPLAAIAQAAPPRGLDIERDWLDGRFRDIAAKVERSLAEMRPDGSFNELGQRFEEFEQRLGVALGDVATRADVEGLRLVEAHISELTSHFEHAQTQLSRLDVIEAHLSALLDRAEAPALPAAAIPTPRVSEQDIERVAAAVAGRLSTQLPAAEPRADIAGDGAEVGEIKDLISGLISERREGDEHTAAMLDTMQQALMRLLDRMDSLEQSYASAPGARFAGAHPPHAAHAAHPAGEARPAPAAQPHGMPAHAAPVHATPAHAAQLHAAAEPIRHSPADLAPLAAAHAAGGPKPESRLHTPAERQPAPRDPSPAGIVPAAVRGGERSREDFVAAARRAARHASERQQQETLAAPALEAPEPRRAEVLAKPKSRLNPRVMVATLLVALIGSGVAYTALRKPAAKSVAVERKLLAPTGEERAERPVAKGDVAGAGEDAGAVRRDEPAAATPKIGSAGKDPAARGEVVRPAPSSAQPAPVPTPPPAARPEAAAPATPKRSVPETMIDELSNEVDPGTPRAPYKEAGIVGRVVNTPPGVTLQSMDAPITPEQMVRVQHQKTVASFSNTLGSNQSELPSMPASLVPQPAAPEGAQVTDAARASELPPAAIGPMSLRAAAAKGDPTAEFEVGARFAEGKGIQQDLKQAVVWYQRAASKGFAPAQYRLGTLLERGLGVKPDVARARIWYARAAEQGNVKAMHNLAVLSAGRDQETPDYGTAAQWFGQAAQRGLADSQFNLAVLYESGLGVPRDPSAAYQWFALAARGGDKEAARRRDALKAKLSPADLAAADASVAGFQTVANDAAANDPRLAGDAWKARQSLN